MNMKSSTPGDSEGQGDLMQYNPCGHKAVAITTEQQQTHILSWMQMSFLSAERMVALHIFV